MPKFSNFNIKTIAIVGTLLLFLAYYNYSQYLTLVENGIKTNAVVVDVNISTEFDEDGIERVSYLPIFIYKVDNNIEYHYKPSVYSSNLYKIGDEVVIYYDVNDPSQATLSTVSGYTILFLISSSIFFFIAVAARYSNYLKKRKIDINFYPKKITVKSKYIYIKKYEKEGDFRYVVYAQWYNKTENKVYVFRSKLFKENPNKGLKNIEVNIYTKENSLKDYIFDID